MLDPKLLRNSLELVETALQKRRFEVDLKIWKKLETSRKNLQSDTEKMKASLNTLSKEIGKLKAEKKDSSKKEKEASVLTKEIKEKSLVLDSILQKLKEFNLGLPNIPDSDVPDGNSEKDNKEIRVWGNKPDFSFKPKDHLELGKLIGGIVAEESGYECRHCGFRGKVMHWQCPGCRTWNTTQARNQRGKITYISDPV